MNFPTTQWTALAVASMSGDSMAREALARICDSYHKPVLAFLRSRGHSEADAQDFTQEFFVQLLDSRAWKRADRSRGRFRTFVLGILMHVVARERARAGTEKRGGGQILASIEEMDAAGETVAVTSEADVSTFDREWALNLMETALANLEASCGADGTWLVLARFLPGAGAPPGYEEAAAQAGLSLPALKTAVHRVRQRFREELRGAVARTVSAAHEIDDELAYLHRVLSSPGA